MSKMCFKASSNGERRGSRTHVVGKSAVSQRSAVYIQAHRLMIYGCVMVRLVGWMDDGWLVGFISSLVQWKFRKFINLHP